MAARPATQPLPITVIDLTASDDEDDLPAHSHSNQYSSATVQHALQLLSSDRGLILPKTVDFSATQQSNRSVSNATYATVLPKASSSQASRPNLLPRRRSAPRAPSKSTPTKNQPSVEQSFVRIGSPAPDHISVRGLENAAKRRRLDGDLVSLQSSTVASTPVSSSRPAAILPPIRNKAPDHAKTSLYSSKTFSDGRDQVPRPETFLPATQAKNNPRTSSIRRANQSVVRSALLPAIRLQHASPRISLGGQVQKPRGMQREASSPTTKEVERMEYVLRNQVITHVKTAIARYRISLSDGDRASIWQQAVSRLTGAQKFIENYAATKWALSSEYEQELSHEAKVYVETFASEILRNRVLGASAENAYGSTLEPHLNSVTGKEIVMTSSSSSDTEEEVFENVPATRNRLPSSPIARQYSSSPTTSFSLDLNDGASIVDVDGSDDVDDCISTKRSQIPRQLRRSQRASKREMQGVDVIPTLASTQNQGRPTLDALWEIESLRLAGAATARPYLTSRTRSDIRRGIEVSKSSSRSVFGEDQALLQGSVYHVDFCQEELEFICEAIQAVTKDASSLNIDLRSQIVGLMRGQESRISEVSLAFQQMVKMPGKEITKKLFCQRDTAAIDAFLYDAVEGKIAYQPQISHLGLIPRQKKKVQKTARPLISSLLRQREIDGMAPIRVRRGQQLLKVEAASYLEDELVFKSEWTDCCGDISTVCWTSDDTFICGATAHSDYHNMQYNKPGNLVVGSATLDTLRAVSNHRVKRPVISSEHNAENALESMRQTQDPWLYTSVVSTSHNELNGYSFSASFDHTVKIWNVAQDGTMNLCGAWYHDGKVNFVVTSEHHEKVATASDVCSNAIRVYNFDPVFDSGNVVDTPYDTYCGEKAREQALEITGRDTWAYFPATIQWGKSPGVVNFLLVGYSPRSITAHEIDIPEDKRNSGELCLWNVEYGTRIPISSAKTQNVFEVIWHPTQPIFLAATSPCGNFELETRTQVRLFAQNESGAFLHIKALDCPAFDINELTVMPNSTVQCYVTASCTDGNTYVWDTARGDDPIHTLGHGESLDNPIHDLPQEIADTGVKFAAWGKTTDRFYTGSSDGKVKAWDVRRPRGHAFVRTVLSVSGGVSAGAFSKDHSKLLIGDATGKVHLLGVDDSDLNDAASSIVANEPFCDAVPTKVPRGSTFPARRPKVIIPHPQPDPPPGFEQEDSELTAHEISLMFLEEGHLTIHPDHCIGAIQGPNYAETLLYRYEAHEKADGTLPLLPEWQAKQRYEAQRREEHQKFPCLPHVTSSDQLQHAQNVELDFEFSRLSVSTQLELTRDNVDLDWEPSFEYELMPRTEIFKEPKARQKRTHSIK